MKNKFRRKSIRLSAVVVAVLCCMAAAHTPLYAQDKPNVILIYADDLGYGDLSCYGAVKLHTPHIDKLAAQGLRFTNAHTTSSTCTPSRYGLITGKYPWRKEGTNILPGDAALIIPTNAQTLPGVFRQAGYETGIVGKWHLGLGDALEKNWNGDLRPGPLEVGFDYAFIFPATADRVPTVFIENHRIIGLDPSDTIKVNYKTKVGDEPTGKENPELLTVQSSQGHNNTIVNGIGRIGFMSGGKLARWKDEELSFTFLHKAEAFIEKERSKPFFLCFNLTEPHVPRMPATIFKGTSGLGFRGDAILQLDWAVGEIMKLLKSMNLDKNTMIIFSSDNGPVKDDGYVDGAVTQLNGHTPAGVLRGGKSSLFEGGTRVPFIVSWPGKIKPGISDALVGQIDLGTSFASFFRQRIPAGSMTDGENTMDAFLGKAKKGRTQLVEHSGTLAIVKDNWKYIAPSNRQPYFKATDTETGGSKEPQLYDLFTDIGERNNLAGKYPQKVAELAALLTEIQQKK